MRVINRIKEWLWGPERPMEWYEIKDRTYKKRERLSEEENELMQKYVCPDCGEKLLVGPSGGGAVNLLCSNEMCGSKYNALGLFGGERISDSKGSLTLFEEHKN
jgi:hypothetical protein